MIETVAAQNGSRVLRDDGRWLASAVDPQAEARAWLARRQEFLDKVETVIVLGAGAGYHVRELLLRATGHVLVIEARAEVIQAVRAIHGAALAAVKMIEIETVRALRAHEDVRAAVARSFVVVQHGPSLAANPALYRELHAQLMGRDWAALSWQWQMTGLPALDSQPQIQRGATPLSLLDLEQTELVQDSEERERMLFKALRELIK